MKKEKSVHPILNENHGTRQKNGALWNTHAAFPVSHLAELTEFEQASVGPSVEMIPLDIPPAIKRIPTQAEISDLSPFTQWLLDQKPATVDGVPAPSAPDVHIPVDPDQTLTEKALKKDKTHKAKKKKKDKKKRKKKKKDKARDARESGKHRVLETGIVTDTLAELAAEQGYLEDAIAMYRRLVHLHPERTAFYLERIHTLKKEDSEE
jgi:hypothetical protein